MRDTPLILSASPRDGNGLTLARRLLALARASGVSAELVELRRHVVRPCVACGFCATHPLRCALDAGMAAGNASAPDMGSALLARIAAARVVLIVTPVYCYGPPAQLKALIDRAQTYWEAREQGLLPAGERPLYTVLTAARTGGGRLFEASGLILRCFARIMGLAAQEPLCLRGLDGPADAAAPDVLAALEAWSARGPGWTGQEAGHGGCAAHS